MGGLARGDGRVGYVRLGDKGSEWWERVGEGRVR